MTKKLILAGFAAIALFSTGCFYDKEELLYPGGSNCQGVANKFAADVHPIIQTKCAINAGCHAAGSTNAGGALTTYDAIKNKAGSIKLQVQTGLMPQLGSLTAAELKSIVCWVDAGAPNN